MLTLYTYILSDVKLRRWHFSVWRVLGLEKTMCPSLRYHFFTVFTGNALHTSEPSFPIYELKLWTSFPCVKWFREKTKQMCLAYCQANRYFLIIDCQIWNQISIILRQESETKPPWLALSIRFDGPWKTSHLELFPCLALFWLRSLSFMLSSELR